MWKMASPVVAHAPRTVISARKTHYVTVMANVNVTNTGTTTRVDQAHAAQITLVLVTGDALPVLDPQITTVSLVVETQRILVTDASVYLTGQVSIVIPGMDHVIAIVLVVVTVQDKNTVIFVDLTPIV